MKFNFKLNLKVSAFYLEKHKSFIPKKEFLGGCQYQNKKALFTDSIFQKFLRPLIYQKWQILGIANSLEYGLKYTLISQDLYFRKSTEINNMDVIKQEIGLFYMLDLFFALKASHLTTFLQQSKTRLHSIKFESQAYMKTLHILLICILEELHVKLCTHLNNLSRDNIEYRQVSVSMHVHIGDVHRQQKSTPS